MIINFTVTATAGGIDIHAEITDRVDNTPETYAAAKASAIATLAELPKTCGFRATTLSGADYELDENGKPVKVDGQWVHLRNWVSGYLHMTVKTATDGVNGGVNETGIRRYRSFQRAVAKGGHKVEWATPYGNSLTEAELEALIG